MTLSPQAERRAVQGLISGIIVTLAIGALFLYRQNQEQAQQIADLTTKQNDLSLKLASTTLSLLSERDLSQSTINELSERLSLTAEELDDITDAFKQERDRNEEFEDQIKEIAGTVGVLDKLSKTDRELLKKYSRTYFLNENFMPLKLVQIPARYLMDEERDQYFHDEALDFLTDMLDAAKRADHEIKIISAFRSFDEQRDVKNSHSFVYGSGANAFSADQGYSEHQLGTTVDIVDTTTRLLVQEFGKTTAFTWLVENAHRYGFILSYPEGNQFYIYEPWHWRFVGRELATDLKSDGRSFYDLDQRELDTYLVKIFD